MAFGAGAGFGAGGWAATGAGFGAGGWAATGTGFGLGGAFAGLNPPLVSAR